MTTIPQKPEDAYEDAFAILRKVFANPKVRVTVTSGDMPDGSAETLDVVRGLGIVAKFVPLVPLPCAHRDGFLALRDFGLAIANKSAPVGHLHGGKRRQGKAGASASP